MGAAIVSQINSGTMPPYNPLSDNDAAIITAWVDNGVPARDPQDPEPSIARSLSSVYYKTDMEHLIPFSDIKGRYKISPTIQLRLQQDGRNIGLGLEILQF